MDAYEVRVISGINKVEVSVISRAEQAEVDNTYRDHNYLGISQKQNLIIVWLYIVLKKITTNTPLQGTWIDIVIGNHALWEQPTD